MVSEAWKVSLETEKAQKSRILVIFTFFTNHEPKSHHEPNPVRPNFSFSPLFLKMEQKFEKNNKLVSSYFLKVRTKKT